MDLSDLRVNGKRLQGSLEEMAKIGATPGGGVQRLTLTDEDKQARDLFVTWLKELNLVITVDEMGNIFGKRAGKNNDLPPVMSGSHIDSQPKGGRFDGILGVMGPLEALRTLHENNVETERPIIIVDHEDIALSRSQREVYRLVGLVDRYVLIVRHVMGSAHAEEVGKVRKPICRVGAAHRRVRVRS